jgi:hypothetical protein
MQLFFALLAFTQTATAAPCYEADRLLNTKAALVHFFTNVDAHSCKNVGASEIYLSHNTQKQNGRELIEFFIKCDQAYPVIGKIVWIESGCMASGRPTYFSSAQIVK